MKERLTHEEIYAFFALLIILTMLACSQVTAPDASHPTFVPTAPPSYATATLVPAQTATVELFRPPAIEDTPLPTIGVLPQSGTYLAEAEFILYNDSSLVLMVDQTILQQAILETNPAIMGRKLVFDISEKSAAETGFFFEIAEIGPEDLSFNLHGLHTHVTFTRDAFLPGHYMDPLRLDPPENFFLQFLSSLGANGQLSSKNSPFYYYQSFTSPRSPSSG
jgi:hypothetical protein